jgi:hypothetical protein
MRLKVVQWATGRIGVESIKGIASHPMLDLVGVGVYDPAKVGRDAGDLAGVEDLGVSAVPANRSSWRSLIRFADRIKASGLPRRVHGP